MKLDRNSKTENIFLLCFALISKSWQQEESDYHIRLSSEIELINWDLIDECANLARSAKNFYLDKPNALQDKIEIEIGHGRFLRKHAEALLKYAEDVPYELTRNWTLLTKCGNERIPDEDYQMFINFANNQLERKKTTKIPCDNSTTDCKLYKQDVLWEISRSRNLTNLQNLWSKWQENLKPDDFPSVLQLVNKAAQLNDQYEPKMYWSLLSDIEDVYNKAEEAWNEISPLYQKLHGFVLDRINDFYGTNFTENIPVYLLGSEYGEDWTNIADIVLPHPQIYHDIKFKIEAKTIKNSYMVAEAYTNKIGLGRLGQKFWTGSLFDNAACGPKTIDYCTEKYSEVITCSNNSLPSHLNAYSQAMKMTIARRLESPAKLVRDSAAQEALFSLSELIAMQEMTWNGILEGNEFEAEENRNTAKLLLALKILPALAYYRSVDMWRLDEIEVASGDVVKSWWENRNKFQGVEGVTNTEADFLDDEKILYNRPYVSKFLGLILQFQILNYYQINLFYDKSDIAGKLKIDATFREMLSDIDNRDPLDLLGYHYSLNDVSIYPLQEFFSNLEEYLDTAPLKQAPFTIKLPGGRIPELTTTPTPKVLNESVLEQSDERVLSVKPVEVEVNEVEEEEFIEKGRKGAYIGGFIVVATFCGIAGMMIWKKKKRRGSNNRRDAA